MAYTTQYIGSRYVPMFADPAEWNSARTYEPLTIVLNEGNSYTSRQFVPTGVALTNTDYWLETGNYNAQVEAYRQEVLKYTNTLNNTMLSFESLTEAQKFASSNNIAVGEIIVINAKPYIVSNEPANNMDIIALTDALLFSLSRVMVPVAL